MTTTIDVRTLFITAAKEGLFAAFLDLAQGLGLPVTSWRTGDPTLVEGQFLSEQLETRDNVSAEFAKAGFLSTAEGDWLPVHASEIYGVKAQAATFSEPTVTLANVGGGIYDLAPGQLTVKCGATQVTFHNTDNPGTLSGGVSRTYKLVADVQGSDGTVALNDINSIISPALLLVNITGSTAATGLDEQSPQAVKEQCTSTLGALSSAGPGDAYESICRDPTKTGNSEITRARTADNSSNGLVTTYVAGPSGAASGPAVTAAQNACVTWAEPIGFQQTTAPAVNRVINVSIQVSGDAVPSDVAGRGTVLLGSLFASLDIAAASGETISTSLFESLIHSIAPFPDIRKVVVITPAGDTVLVEGEVPKLGTVSIVEV